MSRWWGLVLVMVASCQATEHPRAKSAVTVHVPEAKTAPAPVNDLVTKADRALADSMKIDYRRPFLSDPIDSAPIRLAYLRACRNGDHRACWMVGNVWPTSGKRDAYDEEAEAMVLKNCLAGDLLSCRALREPDRLPGDPSHVAILNTCLVDDQPCDIDGLRRECRAGFPSNCERLMRRQPAAADLPEIVALTQKLVHEGCRQGILSECESLRFLKSSASEMESSEQIWALEQVCGISGFDCFYLGIAYDGLDYGKARDAYERACQLMSARTGDLTECHELWRMYSRPQLGITEPVPGRAKQLRDWACEKHQECWK